LPRGRHPSDGRSTVARRARGRSGRRIHAAGVSFDNPRERVVSPAARPADDACRDFGRTSLARQSRGEGLESESAANLPLTRRPSGVACRDCRRHAPWGGRLIAPLVTFVRRRRIDHRHRRTRIGRDGRRLEQARLRQPPAAAARLRRSSPARSWPVRLGPTSCTTITSTFSAGGRHGSASSCSALTLPCTSPPLVALRAGSWSSSSSPGSVNSSASSSWVRTSAASSAPSR
jgi:hypothetical protein